ncbi:MAG: hypothetical protein PF487_09100 [Bacteroidales bacterium]|jgi:hypothetical protein|nr:hypothetical protein [Bacteroidales bacterium]
MQNEIKNLLEAVLPSKTIIEVSEHEQYFSNEKTLRIVFYPQSETVNGVRGQYPEVVSLSLSLDTLELQPQIYGGNGGQCIYRTPDENNPYLAMQRIKIPFRKPKPEQKFILAAIKRFAERWLQTIKDNKDVLIHHDLVNYDEFLNS